MPLPCGVFDVLQYSEGDGQNFGRAVVDFWLLSSVHEIPFHINMLLVQRGPHFTDIQATKYCSRPRTKADPETYMEASNAFKVSQAEAERHLVSVLRDTRM